MRQPAIEKLLVIEYSSTAHSLAPSACRMLGGLTPVEADVGVGEVVDDDHLALAAEVDDALHERRGRRLAPVGLCGNEITSTRGFGQPMSYAVWRLSKKSSAKFWRGLGMGEAAHRHLAQVGAGEQRAVDVDRVARAGHDRRVATVEQHPHQVAEALLRADRVGDLELGVELDVPRARVVAGDRLAQLRAAHGSASSGGCAGSCAASASFSTAIWGDGMSGLPKPRSITSAPARRASIFRLLMIVNTYGGRFVMRRNSMTSDATGCRYDALGCGSGDVG